MVRRTKTDDDDVYYVMVVGSRRVLNVRSPGVHIGNEMVENGYRTRGETGLGETRWDWVREPWIDRQ